MTRKDYVAIASAFAQVRADGYADVTPESSATVEILESAIVNVLSADNPRFDRERFLRACRGE